MSPEHGCAVAGHVYNQSTGEPLEASTLRLDTPSLNLAELGETSFQLFGTSASKKKDAYAATSSSDGKFCFQSVKTGVYVLLASRQGFLDSSYGAAKHSATGKLLKVSEEEGLVDISVRLPPLSGIMGKLADDDGNPVVDQNVVAVRQVWTRGRRVFVPVQGTQSNGLGEYRIGNLPPGSYYVYAQPIPFVPGLSTRKSSDADPSEKVDHKIVRTYYPNQTSLIESQAVSVTTGDDLRGIDIRVQRSSTFHVRGHVVASKEALVDGSVAITSANESQLMLLLAGNSNVGSDGFFDLSDVAPGNYDLSFRSAIATSHLQVTVRESDVLINLPTLSNAELSGKLFVDSTSKDGPRFDFSSVKASLVNADSVVELAYPVRVGPDGRLAADHIPSGKYYLKLSPLVDYYVKSIDVGGSASSSSEIDLSAGGVANMTILLKAGLGTVSGKVDRGAKSSVAETPPTNIILIANSDDRYHLDTYESVSDQGGQFSLSSVKPGRYRVLAVESIDVSILQNPLTLQSFASLGTEVEVREGDNAGLSVRKIAQEDLLRSMANLDP